MLHDLAATWAGIMVFALGMYTTLDGFDLGVGILLLRESTELNRDLMIRSIAPVWDGNETWIVLTAVALLGGFPVAYGILLPAFYIPAIAMLLCLAFRGTAFEFRFQTIKYRYIWDLAFGVGSIGAAFCQGLILGGLASGVSVKGESFSGSVFDFFNRFSVFTGVGVMSGYTMLGTLWLAYRMRGQLQFRMTQLAKLVVPSFCLFVFLALAFSAKVNPRLAQSSPSVRFVLLPAFVVLFAVTCLWQNWAGNRLTAFLSAVAVILAAFASVALAVWPYVVPFQFTLWQAASAEKSQIALLVGVCIAIPLILTYSAYAYYVFRGPVTAEDPDPVNYLKELGSDANV